MNTNDHNRTNTPEPSPTDDANTRDENQHKPEQQRTNDDQMIGRVPTSKGTDTPATTGAEYAEREHGKRTTM